MTDQYVIKQTPKNKTWEIVKFDDGDEPSSIYKVSERNGFYHCDCPGFWRQKVKEDHKHTRLVKFWRENLEEASGYFLWFDKQQEIEYTTIGWQA
jgi:hypothetical protein